MVYLLSSLLINIWTVSVLVLPQRMVWQITPWMNLRVFVSISLRKSLRIRIVESTGRCNFESYVKFPSIASVPFRTFSNIAWELLFPQSFANELFSIFRNFGNLMNKTCYLSTHLFCISLIKKDKQLYTWLKAIDIFFCKLCILMHFSVEHLIFST